MKRVLFIAWLGLMPGLVWGAFSSSDKGTTAAAFLKLGAGAREAGMGDAGAAAVEDASAMYWNPAALTRVQGQSAVFMHAAHIAPTYYDFGAYARRLEHGTLGISWQHFNAGTLTETDPSGQEVGHFSPSDTAFSLAWAVPTDRVPGLMGGSFGMSAKYIRSTILESASAWATDIGMLMPPLLRNRWRWGMVVTNLGTSMKFEQQSDPLPMTIRFANAYEVSENWTGIFDLVVPRDNKQYVAMGAEGKMPLSHPGWLALGRVGYNSRSTGDVDGISGPTLGTGLNLSGFKIDYAFMPMGNLGATHRFSIGFDWGAPEKSNKSFSTHANAKEDDRDTSLEQLLSIPLPK